MSEWMLEIYVIALLFVYLPSVYIQLKFEIYLLMKEIE